MNSIFTLKEYALISNFRTHIESNQDIGFIKVGMSARVKVDAYPFQQFGSVPARIQQITPDVNNKDHFVLTLDLLQDSIKTDEKNLNL